MTTNYPTSSSAAYRIFRDGSQVGVELADSSLEALAQYDGDCSAMPIPGSSAVMAVLRHSVDAVERASALDALKGFFPVAYPSGFTLAQAVKRPYTEFDVQAVAGRRVRFIEHPSHGGLVAIVDESTFVPVGLLSLASGSDSWMRLIRIPCSCCGVKGSAGSMESDLCSNCFDESGAENERQDGLRD